MSCVVTQVDLQYVMCSDTGDLQYVMCSDTGRLTVCRAGELDRFTCSSIIASLCVGPTLQQPSIGPLASLSAFVEPQVLALVVDA